MSQASSETTPLSDTDLCQQLLSALAEDLTLMLDRDVALAPAEVERAVTRPAGEACVHISFKVGFREPDGPGRAHGALLVPLPEAITMGSYMIMAPDEEVTAARKMKELDADTKDAIVEVSHLVGRALDSCMVELHQGRWRACSLGCQGVRADVRPAMQYQEGDELIVARTTARIGKFPQFPLILILPVLPSGAAE